MTPKEFKEKFKSGDVIWCTQFDPIEILFIGDMRFFGKVLVTKEEFDYDFLFDWEKVEPKKKPSEEIRERMDSNLTFTITESEANTTQTYVPNTIKTIIKDKADYIIDWLDENWPKVQLKGE